MGSTAAEHHSSFAFEQSLRRSFYAIHHDGSGSDIKVRNDSLLKRDRHGKDIRRKSILRCNRRASLPTDMPSHAHMIRAFLSDELPVLPFSKGESPQPQRESSRERTSEKFQRRYSSVKADMAQVKVTKLTCEKQHVRRHSMEVRMADNNERPKPRRRASVTCVRSPHFSPVRVADNNERPKPRRRSSVTFASPPTTSSMENDKKQTVKEQNKGFRHDYSIGETVRSQSHMIIEPTPEQAIQAVSSLNKHDFAFVKRSDGSHSYAILAYRSMEPIKGAKNTEECMTFVMSDVGATKMVREKYWHKFVRLVSMEGLDSCPVSTTTTKAEFTTKTCATPKCPPSHEHYPKEHSVLLRQEIIPPVLCQEIEHDDDWVPPNMIAFVPQMGEECSLISSVSDRARGLTRRHIEVTI